MKYCSLLTQIFVPVALGAAFTASNGPGVGFALGISVALALQVHRRATRET